MEAVGLLNGAVARLSPFSIENLEWSFFSEFIDAKSRWLIEGKVSL